ncbi:hypothetical protein G7054_g7801 [Neopestalotiopsis clavispora]|nr:hypothetical protein G7054_g7801 [Neopestalotiopsis clavispora]
MAGRASGLFLPDMKLPFLFTTTAHSRGGRRGVEVRLQFLAPRDQDRGDDEQDDEDDGADNGTDDGTG